MTRRLAFLIVLLTPLVTFADSIVVSAAISLREAMNEIAETYQQETSEQVRFIFGSSGQLMAQIKSGAPVDVFISAADKQVDDLCRLNLTDTATRRVIAGNTLVLIVPAQAPFVPSSPKDLADPRLKRLAIGHPPTVPAGQYAMQAIASAKLTDALADRLVYGANVRQVLDYVERAEVTAAFVYATDAKASANKVRVAFSADPACHDPIRYPAIVIKATRHPIAAKRFLDYLASDKASAILIAKGFATNSGTSTAPTSK